MRTICFLIALLCVPTFVGAQQQFSDYVDAMGDQPNAIPCVKLNTLLKRAGRARINGKSEAEARNVLKQHISGYSPMAEDAIRAIYDNPKTDHDSIILKEEDESTKCEIKYGLVKGPYQSTGDFAKQHDTEIRQDMKKAKDLKSGKGN